MPRLIDLADQTFERLRVDEMCNYSDVQINKTR